MKGTREDFLQHKEAARKIIEERIQFYCRLYPFVYNRISIRNQSTRWGSCSRKGNLNFNYRLALLEERERDYVIVHELCHLLEFNHSQNFWHLVAKFIPEFREIRKALKSQQMRFL